MIPFTGHSQLERSSIISPQARCKPISYQALISITNARFWTGLRTFFHYLLQNVFVQGQVGHRLLQFAVLLFQEP
jgi:hypothetical protein